MWPFRATSSSTCITSDVQSMYIPPSIQDWYQEDKNWAKDKRYSFCLWIVWTKNTEIRTKLTISERFDISWCGIHSWSDWGEVYRDGRVGTKRFHLSPINWGVWEIFENLVYLSEHIGKKTQVEFINSSKSIPSELAKWAVSQNRSTWWRRFLFELLRVTSKSTLFSRLVRFCCRVLLSAVSFFCIHLGWTTMNVHSGWVQVIRGPKPFFQRPQVIAAVSPVPAIARIRVRCGADKIRSIEAALSALGPEETLQEIFTRQKGQPASMATQTPSRPRQSPKWTDSRKLWMPLEVSTGQRSMPSWKHCGRPETSPENDPFQNLFKSARCSWSVPQAHRQVESRVGGRDRIFGAESRQVHRFCSWRWSPGVVFATDGESVASAIPCPRSCAAVVHFRCVHAATDLKMSATSLLCQIKHRICETHSNSVLWQIAFVSHLSAQGAAKLVSLPRGGVVPDPNAMEVHTGPGGCVDRCRECQAQVFGCYNCLRVIKHTSSRNSRQG